MGLNHASSSDTEYGDLSSYMGLSETTSWLPRKCYNAAQHASLGWYDTQTVSLTVEDLEREPIYRVELAAFVHHARDASKAVLVQLPGGVSLQLNRAESYNAGTDPLLADQVVVTLQNSDGTTSVLAGLSDKSSFQYFVTLNNGRVPITIGVCRYDSDVAVLRIGTDDDDAAGCSSAPLYAFAGNGDATEEEAAVGEDSAPDTTIGQAAPQSWVANPAPAPTLKPTSPPTDPPVPAPIHTPPVPAPTRPPVPAPTDPLVPAPTPRPTTPSPTPAPEAAATTMPTTNGAPVHWVGRPTIPVSSITPQNGGGELGDSPSAASADDDDGKDSSALSTNGWLLVGGGLFLLALIVAGVVTQRRRRRRKAFFFSSLDFDEYNMVLENDNSHDDFDEEVASSGSRAFNKRIPSTPMTENGDISCSSVFSWSPDGKTVEVLWENAVVYG